MPIDRKRLERQRARSLGALSDPDLPQDIRELYKKAADKAEAVLELDAALARRAARLGLDQIPREDQTSRSSDPLPS